MNFEKKRWPSYLKYFRNYPLRKTWLDKCLKYRVSEDPSKNNIVKEPKHCWNLNDSTFTIFLDQSERNWLTKRSLLVICKILRLFFNRLSSDGKYSLLNTDNLMQPIQMELSQKQKTFSEFFDHFWNLVQFLNFLKKRWPS